MRIQVVADEVLYGTAPRRMSHPHLGLGAAGIQGAGIDLLLIP